MENRSIILTLIVVVLFSFAISTWGLTESSEARYAQISKEMVVNGDYIHPTLLGIYHFHKPPLTYYITGLGYALFGFNEAGARFFLMIALLLQLLLVYKITRAFYDNNEVAMATMLIYFSYPIVQIATKNLTTDAYLACFIFAAVWFFICFKQQQKIIYLYLFYGACGLAFLTKGPVGIMPQALFAIWYQRKYPTNQPGGMHRYTALILGLLVSFSWFILLVINNPGLLNYFIKHQLVDRVASGTFNRTQPWWYYLLTMPLLGLPSIIYFIDYLRTRRRQDKINSNPSGILLFSLGISFLIFSLSSSKLVLYVLPLYLFIAMLSGMQLVNMTGRSRKFVEKISLGYACLIFSGLIISCFYPMPFPVPKIAIIPLATSGMLGSFVIYFRKYPTPIMTGPLLNAWVMTILILSLPFIMSQNESRINSIRPLAKFINEHSGNNGKSTIAVYDYLLPSLSFYTNKRIITIDNGNTKRETQFENTDEKNDKDYIKIENTKSIQMLSLLLKQPESFLIARKNNDLPDSLSVLTRSMHHKLIFDKWVIYY